MAITPYGVGVVSFPGDYFCQLNHRFVLLLTMDERIVSILSMVTILWNNFFFLLLLLLLIFLC